MSKIKDREEAKKAGNYKLADQIRNDLNKEGIDIKDEKGKTTGTINEQRKIYIFDTTLRDGAQTEELIFQLKIKIRLRKFYPI